MIFLSLFCALHILCLTYSVIQWDGLSKCKIAVVTVSLLEIFHIVFLSSFSISLFSVCRCISVLQSLMTFLVNDITSLLIPVNSRDLIYQLCGTLSKSFMIINPCHTQSPPRLYFCSIAFEISSWSLHPFDLPQHPFCSFGIRFSSSIYFCTCLFIIDVMSLYIVGKQVTGL